MNRLFGWDYPPGAANDPNAPYNQVDGPCAVCTCDEENCICPECPICGAVGDPDCYEDIVDPFGRRNGHGLTRTEEQIEIAEETCRRGAEEAKAEYDYWVEQEKKLGDPED